MKGKTKKILEKIGLIWVVVLCPFVVAGVFLLTGWPNTIAIPVMLAIVVVQLGAIKRFWGLRFSKGKLTPREGSPNPML